MPNRIQLTDSALDIITKLSNGNPGAVSVLARWITDGPKIDPDACHPVIQMCSLDDMDIVGPDIWILWKDVCGQDLRTFLGVLRAHQLGHLTTTGLKRAIRDERAHKLDIPALLAHVEAFLPSFQRNGQPPSVDAVARPAADLGKPSTRDKSSSSSSSGTPPQGDQ